MSLNEALALLPVVICKAALLFFGFQASYAEELTSEQENISEQCLWSLHTTKLISAKSPILGCIHPGILKRLKNVKIELLTKMVNLSLKSDCQLQEQKKQIYYQNLPIDLKNPNIINMLYQENSLKGMLKIDI